MLKRCQILLEDWQEEYLKDVADRYDQSFSEVTRIVLAEGFLYIISLLHPEYKSRITGKHLTEMTKKAGNTNIPEEERHKSISKLYFESRKAVEYRISKVKNKKKRNH